MPADRDVFAGFHPLVGLSFFTVVIGFTMLSLHPAALVLSFACAASYAICLQGKKALLIGLAVMLPMLILTAALNPLFNHQGVTILGYLPNSNPITFESLMYGIAAAGRLVTVIAWFSCLNAVMTSDKFTYLFGRVLPVLSLLLSMTLRFVPRFIAQLKTIALAQRGIGLGMSGGVMNRARQGMKILSILVTWALENSIETAESMKSRGYGLPGRTAFSIYTFRRRDAYAMAYISICTAAMLAGAVMGAYGFRYFPSIQGQWTHGGTASFFIVYFALGALPTLLMVKEALYWKRIESAA
jgi:energy-coupling factor transport system permease protein